MRTDYSSWNTTDVQYALDALVRNRAGAQARIAGFVAWYEANRPDGYLPSSGAERMYTRAALRDALAAIAVGGTDPDGIRAILTRPHPPLGFYGEAFAPRGFFESLLVRVLGWCRATGELPRGAAGLVHDDDNR